MYLNKAIQLKKQVQSHALFHVVVLMMQLVKETMQSLI